jgi:hypothetical protein
MTVFYMKNPGSLGFTIPKEPKSRLLHKQDLDGTIGLLVDAIPAQSRGRCLPAVGFNRFYTAKVSE